MSLQGRQLKVKYAYYQVADEIQRQILDGSLKPGERLPGEVELAEMFGVTRSTVREGLRQLENDGLVHRPSPRRLEVSLPQMETLTTRNSRAMAMMRVSFRHLWQVALATEPLAADLAALLITEEEKVELRDIHAELLDSVTDVDRTIELDTRFHSFIATAAKNPALMLAREPVALLLYRGFAQVAPVSEIALSRQAEAHTHITDAICAGDRDLARTWGRRHIEDFWKAINKAGLADAPAIKSAEGI
ncbi:GntR family transcriptional regulator [Primorskyibacter flagellatus]|uniref:GntR family transcriptional regulator n=1 Tax=Primorskyibacter flagellatus TaxID=1387277 RepID=A0A917AEL3_9RHOB|nr:GntR family transcriptional regulator [Primorskyibacter flagellatus]GGE47061.1 GntR family transcriptional regulator [Primorskyibacter flagellatus]